MAKTNYNKMSTKTEEVVEETISESTEVTKEVEETKMDEITSNVIEVRIGIVTGCARLNVRKGPDITCKVDCTLLEGTEVTIYDEVGDFYKIENPDSNKYCMKKYISIK